MLNYQYIFYAIGAYSALNWKDIAETLTYGKRNVASVILVVLVTVYFMYITKHGNAVINHVFRLVYIVAMWFVLDYIPSI